MKSYVLNERSVRRLPTLSSSPVKISRKNINLSDNQYANIVSCGDAIVGFCPGEDKVNQDYVYQSDLNTKRGVARLRMVADGHGLNGHYVSKYCCEKLVEVIDSLISHHDDAFDNNWTIDTMKTAFKQVDEALSSSNIEIRNSGSTMTILIVWQDHIVISNIGDSKCVLVSKLDKGYGVKMSTSLHHPDEDREKTRIYSAGGIVTPMKLKNGEFDGPMRVWKPNYSGPGLAVARAFGDSEGKETGVISEPGIHG